FRLLAHYAAHPGRTHPPSSDPPRRAVTAPLDRDAALACVAGDLQLLRLMIDLFRTDYPRLLRDIRQAIDAHDAGLLRRQAHTLKGTAGHLGARSVVEAALVLEMMGKNGNLAEVEPAYARLEETLRQVVPLLDSLVAPRQG